MQDGVVIASAVRTPVGKFGRALRDVSAQRLGSVVIKQALRRAAVRPDHVEQVVMGNVISAGLGQNPARQSAVEAGIPYSVTCFTLNEVCGSGLKSVMVAAQMIRAGDCQVVVAGGMESMSCAPHLLRGLRWGVKFGEVRVADAMLSDGLWDVYGDYHMGMTGERVAEKFGVTRAEADEFALRSHRKAAAAAKEGRFSEEIIPVTVDGTSLESDECVREDTSLEKLTRLAPVFRKDGILTAGNSSQLSDGAAAVVVMSARRAEELAIKPLARIVASADGGTRPEDAMEAPIHAVRRMLAQVRMTIGDIDLVEHNEAYAPASIVVSRELAVPPEKFNVNGGAVALGHPIGCSGARILVTLVHALKQRDLKRGLATLCIGGGNTVAMIVER
ncbi:MAG: acetyl-CoA C-acetyltransferase [Chloroflexota bacterium]